MKRQLLGKLTALMFLPLFLFADVKESVDKNALYMGDSVTYTITVVGKDVEFPTITEIDGNPILSTSGSQNISIINGDFQKTVSKSYIFTPKDSLEIPSYKVLLNGGVEMTKPIGIKIVEPSQDKSAPVVLDIRLSKQNAHVGELVRFDLVFKQKPNVPVYKLDIEEPQFEDFWVKKMAGSKEGVEGEYTTKTYSYLLFAQRSGELSIPSVTANVGQLAQQQRRGMDPFFNSAFGQQLRYTKVFSNELILNVEALPNGLELYGDFNIDVEADRTAVAANKPLNITISIEGIGNIDDVKKYTLDIEGAVIYANEPVIKARVEGEDYLGSFEQKIVIIADGSYTIPPLQLRYFDRESQKEVIKESQPIEITVTGGVAKVSTVQSSPESKIELSQEIKAKPELTEKAVATTSDWRKLLYAVFVGFGIGGLFVWLMMRSRSENAPKKSVATPIETQIKKAKNDKALFELLLPYKKESDVVETALVQLEENLYRGANNSVDKKVLIKYFSEEEQEIELI
ncbi:MAG: BatD family protein [Sulfurimonadaceae bacterium]